LLVTIRNQLEIILLLRKGGLLHLFNMGLLLDITQEQIQTMARLLLVVLPTHPAEREVAFLAAN
jgi:hypothetical protein